MTQTEKRVGVYETGDGRTIHLGQIFVPPSRPVIRIPVTPARVAALLRAALSARICGVRWSEL